MKNKIKLDDNVCIELNHENYTAQVVESPKVKGEIFIPKSVFYDSHEYVIKSIKEGSFKAPQLKIIKFADDSEIDYIGKETFALSSLISFDLPNKVTQIEKLSFYSCKDLKKLVITENSSLHTIEEYSFRLSGIENIIFSSKIAKLKEGWCSSTKYLNSIIIPQTNPHFGYLDSNHKLIGGKSTPELDYFDTLVFACRDITEASIPSNIRYIGPYSFHQCSKLKTVQINNDSQLISIGKYAFSESSITSIFIPPLVEKLDECCFLKSNIKTVLISPANGHFALIDQKIIIGKTDGQIFDEIVYGLNNVEAVMIPSFIKRIGPFSFMCNKSVKSILLPFDSQLESIGECAFSESSLTSVAISDRIKELGVGCFSSCQSLKTVTFPKHPLFEVISEASFYDTSIEKVVIPENIKKIDTFAFGNCRNLNDVSFDSGSKLEVIGKNAFAGTMIEYISFPSKLRMIDDGAFANSNLKDIIFSRYKPVLETIGEEAFCSNLFEEVYFPHSIKFIKKRAFFNCFMLKGVEFPKNCSLESIDESVFEGCNLYGFSVPSSVKYIKKSAFMDCSNFGPIEIPRNSELISIEKNAFTNTLTEDVSFPASLQDFSGSSYVNVPLNQISIPKKNQYLSIIHNEMVGKKSNVSLPKPDILLFGFSSINIATIPANIKCIAPYAFYYCYDLNTIIFDKKSQLEIISKNSFCSTSITSFYVPKHTKVIGKKAFLDCRSLAKIAFDENPEIKKIEKNAFVNTALSELTIPPSLTELDSCWCSYTPCLKSIVLSPQNPNFKCLQEQPKVIIGKSDANINVFDTIEFACRDITAVVIPSFIKVIKEFAFSDCASLSSVQFEENSSLTKIGKNAFSHTSIGSFVLPQHVKYIHKQAFMNCDKLESFTFHPEAELFFIGNGAFRSTKIVHLQIPKLVTKVGFDCFDSCNELTSIEFLGESFFIDNGLFSNCGKLQSVSFLNAKIVLKDNSQQIEKDNPTYNITMSPDTKLI